MSDYFLKESDAIKTTWMILEGLGYSKRDNLGLQEVVKKVFDTCPKLSIFSKVTALDGKCGVCEWFERCGSSVSGICRSEKSKRRGRILYQSSSCKDFEKSHDGGVSDA